MSAVGVGLGGVTNLTRQTSAPPRHFDQPEETYLGQPIGPIHERSDSETFIEQDNVQVGQLARQLTRHSTVIGHNSEDGSFWSPKKDSPLDPYSSNFDGRLWGKTLLDMNKQSEDGGAPMRTSGAAFRNLKVFGYGSDTDFQIDVGNAPLKLAGFVRGLLGSKGKKVDILKGFDGILKSGEMLVVLGPPGSGCSTLLKTIAGEMDGLNLAEGSYINYQGIDAHTMQTRFKGEAIYTAEVDVHFPNLTVGDTLAFAAQARAPRTPPGGISQHEWALHLRDVAMALFGISHTLNTKVGNDFVRGVSGGERKRVSIAEAVLAGAPLQCWDNSTRGLDSATAVSFCETLRMGTELNGCAAAVAIYQAPQSAYDIFDKVVLLYEGHQIYFGKTGDAEQYFLNLGFERKPQQTIADFLTSMSSPAERLPKKGCEHSTPKSASEFAAAWKSSEEYKQLQRDLDEYEQEHTIGGDKLESFKASRRAQQAKGSRAKSPYTLSYKGQIMLCLRRGFQRLKADPSLTLTQLFGNFAMALIVSSVFYNLPSDTSSFYSRSALLFFAVLLNAFSSALEILTLYAQRQIVEKQARYAFAHPSAEAFASMLTDIPYKVVNCICFNLALYFMSNLRREPGAFFFFIFVSFLTTLQMSMLFRSIASLSKTLAQALAPAAVLILALVIYTGFTIPTQYMLGWSRWINYLDPVAYAFESLMINEFSARSFDCAAYVPSGAGYTNLGPGEQICSSTGSVVGQSFVDGDNYLNSTYQYDASHKWRNVGILIAFLIFQMCVYLLASEFITGEKSKGEVLVFPRKVIKKIMKQQPAGDVESMPTEKATQSTSDDKAALNNIQKQTAIFQWKDVCYDIKIKGNERRILDHVDGWVKPGTMTALMGVSGAGKTTLLDVLATRVTVGVVTGEMLVDGKPRDSSFQRKTGYVQQQDLHLSTSTVREALRFSAILRQPAAVPKQEKLDYVEEVLKLLEMEEYADAVVGVPGEGLNVEQRKRLTIAVELVAKPQLLLFLDEPTSGLDSQTAWSIVSLLQKLTDAGQAILCTIHQPSAILFERFDRLLFLAKGGRTIYFGPLGSQSHHLTEYFERNGARAIKPDENPGEWMLEIIGAAPGSHTDIDFHQVWLDSPERKAVREELDEMRNDLSSKAIDTEHEDKASYKEFGAPFWVQLKEVQIRVFQQYWRTPSYIFAKTGLCVASALFIGFSFFNSPLSQQGLQNQLFSIFMLFTIFGQLVQQIMPNFCVTRALYEVRERPSKSYSWKAFMISQIFVEIPWNTLMSVLIFLCFYYPIGLYNNAIPTDAVNERGGLFFLYTWSFLMFTGSFTIMVIAGIDTAETGGNIANLMFSLCLIFCGVLVSGNDLVPFWKFMYRVSPFTYLVEGFLGVGLANTEVTCAANEYLQFVAPTGQTCGQYLQNYMSVAGGYLLDETASNCSFCALKDTNTFLASFGISFANRWRDFGFLMAYCVFNIFAALALYWLVRVPKQKKEVKTKTE